jgi:hypothetical protein
LDEEQHDTMSPRNRRRLRRPIVRATVVAAALAVACLLIIPVAGAAVTVTPAPFVGEGLAYTLEGTFFLEGFTAVCSDGFNPFVEAEPSCARDLLVATGTVTWTLTPYFCRLLPDCATAPHTDPFNWQRPVISGDCTSGLHVALPGIADDRQYPADWPIAPWGPAKWSLNATSVEIIGDSGGFCALADFLGRRTLAPGAEANLLNALLRM